MVLAVLKARKVSQFVLMARNGGILPAAIRCMGNSATVDQLIRGPAEDETDIEPGRPFE